MEKITRKPLSIICIALLLMGTITVAFGTMEDDEKECAEQLTNLASCIPYVSGTAKQPTKDCCQNAEKVRSAKPKCLCVLIVESTDPSIGLPINTTLALQMPAACKSDAKISDCPSILKLAPGSPNAKIFGAATDSSAASTTNSPNNSDSKPASKSPASSESTKTTSSTSSNSNSNNGAKISTSFLLLIICFVPISLIFL